MIKIKQKLWYSFLSVIPLYLFMFILFVISIIFIPNYINYSLIFIGVIFLISLYKYYYNRSYVYIFTKEKITHKYGLIVTTTDFIELYRIKDYTYRRSVIDRIVGSMTMVLHTSDKTHPTFEMRGIPNSDLTEKLRVLVEQARKIKNVYEID